MRIINYIVRKKMINKQMFSLLTDNYNFSRAEINLMGGKRKWAWEIFGQQLFFQEYTI